MVDPAVTLQIFLQSIFILRPGTRPIPRPDTCVFKLHLLCFSLCSDDWTCSIQQKSRSTLGLQFLLGSPGFIRSRHCLSDQPDEPLPTCEQPIPIGRTESHRVRYFAQQAYCNVTWCVERWGFHAAQSVVEERVRDTSRNLKSTGIHLIANLIPLKLRKKGEIIWYFRDDILQRFCNI